MKFVSLKNPTIKVSFRDALFQGIAADGGLFVPESLPKMSEAFLSNLANYSLSEIGVAVASAFLQEIPLNELQKIIHHTFTFSIPLRELSEQLFLLELFHGPTLAFKDVGARFMAEMLGYFLKTEKQKTTILVATSGDTGSAVARGFYNAANVDVYILYPSKKVSPLQEKQMTTLNNNIHAMEVAGTFDDCQRLVKLSLADEELRAHCHLTTANSINVARLLPQIIYYFWALAQGQKQGFFTRASLVVPSGNFGNLTAAAYAKAMGAPIQHLIAATNSNDVVPVYLQTDILTPRISQQTISNAMDVGNPSNFVRLQALYHDDYQEIRRAVTGISISDEETKAQIKATYVATKSILDPHTAVGVAAAKHLSALDSPLIVAATAHPAKFPEVIEDVLGIEVELPNELRQLLMQPKKSTLMAADFDKWKNFLLKMEKK